ncbi:MAG: hypothetical protein RR232_05895 [Clostridia bacterium]
MDKKLRIITGHYGSGKTEFAVNLCVALASEGHSVIMADMDIVNPYFCSRERKDFLESKGIRVVLPSGGGGIDLPSVSPAVLTLMQSGDVSGVMDVGGDAVGARVLARYAPYLNCIDFDLLCVLNANRPETSNVKSAILYIQSIENSSKQHMSGLVNNTHLCAETTLDDILRGYDLARQVAAEMHIPLMFNCVEKRLLAQSECLLEGITLPIEIYMKKPWETDNA